jgi:hypothetical protein
MTLDDPFEDVPPDPEELGLAGGQDYDDEMMGKGGEDEEGEEQLEDWEVKHADGNDTMTDNDRDKEWDGVVVNGRPKPFGSDKGVGGQGNGRNKEGAQGHVQKQAETTMVGGGGSKGRAGNSAGPFGNPPRFAATNSGGQILWGDDDDDDEDEDEDSQTIQQMTYTKKDKHGNTVTVNAEDYKDNDEPVEALPKHQIYARMEIYVKKGEDGEGAKVNHAEKIKNMIAYMLDMDSSLTILPARGGGNFGIDEIEDFPKTYDRMESFFKIEKEEYKAGGGRLVVGIRLSSKKKLGFFKKNGTDLMAYMREQDIWLVAHKHKTMIVQRVGFILGKCPDHTNKHTYEVALTEELENFMNKDKSDRDKCKAPTFEVVKSKVVHPVKDAIGRVVKKIHTFALEVKCEKHRTRFLRDLIVQADIDANKFGRFIPYAMKWKETTYAQMVSSQNAFLHESLMIPIFGLHEDVLKEEIEGKTIKQWALDSTVKGKTHNGRDANIHPIMAIERTNRTKTLGKWKLMTRKPWEEQASAVFDRIVKAEGMKTRAHRKAAGTGQCFSYGIRRNNVKLQLGDTMENCATNLKSWLQQEETTELIAEPPQKQGGFSLVIDQDQFPELQANGPVAPPKKNAWNRQEEAREAATVSGQSEQGTDAASQAMSQATVQTVLTQVFEQMDKRIANITETNVQSTERLIGHMNKTNERHAKDLGKMQRMCERQQALTMTLTVAMAGLLSTMGPATENIAKQLEPMLQEVRDLAKVNEEDEGNEGEDEYEDEEVLMKPSAPTKATTQKTKEAPIAPTEATEETKQTADTMAGPTETSLLRAQLALTQKQIERAAAEEKDMDTSTSGKKRTTEDRSMNSENRSRGTTKVVVTPGPTAARVDMRNRKKQLENETRPSRSNSPKGKSTAQRNRSKSKERKKGELMESLDPTHGGLVHTANSNCREVDRQNHGGGPSKQD